MTISWAKALRAAVFAGLLLGTQSVRAEYLRIQLRVYGLDCQLCARGVSATIQRMPGVKSVDVSLKTGLLEIVLTPGNTFKMSDLRKRIRENGFRSMEAKVTAVGAFSGSKFEVAGTGESYEISNPDAKSSTSLELTFDVR